MTDQQLRLPDPAGTGRRVLDRRPPAGLPDRGHPRAAGGDHGAAAPRGRTATICLLASLALVAVATLTPEGRGWAWGSPFVELSWYLTGLDSTATMLQLAGNLALLAVPSALAVLRWPTLGRPLRLTGVSLATGSGIELLQRVLPLGRVVSPLDAVLNATGAVAVGLVVTHLRQTRPAAPRH
jgi:hypothetical protein